MQSTISTGASIKPIWPTGSSVEQQFVLALIGVQTPKREEEWRNLYPQVDWDRLLETTRPDLYPYLHFCLQSRSLVESCPERCIQQLAGMRRISALQNLRLLSQFRDIQAALAQENIPVIALKGIALASLAYNDPSLRPMQDTDLLIRPEHVDSTLAVVHRLGYRPPNQFRGHHFEGEIKLNKPGTRELLELHTQIELTSTVYREDGEEIWRRSVERVLPGLTMRILDEEDFLLHLCLHVARRHCFITGLLPLVDILRWVEIHNAKWNWGSFMGNPRLASYEAYVELTLELARDLLGVPIPLLTRSRSLAFAESKQLAWQQISQDRRPQTFVPFWIAELLAGDPLKTRLRRLLSRFGRKREHVSRSVEGISRDLLVSGHGLLKYLRSGALSRTRVQRQARLVRGQKKLEALLRDNCK
jgi:hypothetical protein